MFKGIATFISGLSFLLSQASLRSILWKMLGLLTALMLTLMLGVYFLADYLTQLWLPQDDAWYWQALAWCAWLLAIILSLVAGLAGFAALGSAAVAPWLDDLATCTEQLLDQPSSSTQNGSWLKQSIGSLINSTLPLAGLLGYGMIALFFFWLPPLAAVIWLYASVRFLNFELFDTQASRAGLSFQQRKANIAQQQWFWLGFGGLAMLLMLIPFLNLLVIPAAVVALAKQDIIGELACQS
ncbi:MAG: EI24 domain-containing protein [Ghiorsea sp.]